MKEKLYILFCESPIESNTVDEDFHDEFIAARQSGFHVILFNFEDLTSIDRSSRATRRIPSSSELVKVIYRGWMLTPKQYSVLYYDLLAKNYQLINTPVDYQRCHYLPDSLKFIEKRTPKTVFQRFDNELSLNKLIAKTEVFGRKSIVLKDYVKSEKHDWETACFVPDASDTGRLKQIINRLLELRGTYLNEGIVAREFVELNDLTIHSKSGMPLTEEYRLFFLNNQLLSIYDYWEEGEYLSKPDTSEFEAIAIRIPSNFFTMDIARLKNGELIIIELGDGQVAGLPDNTDRNEFYRHLGQLMV